MLLKSYSRDSEINKLKEEIKVLESSSREKSYTIEKLSYELENKNESLEKQLSQLDKSTSEITGLKSKCEFLERELESFKFRLNSQQQESNKYESSLTNKLNIERNDHLTMLENEVSFVRFYALHSGSIRISQIEIN